MLSCDPTNSKWRSWDPNTGVTSGASLSYSVTRGLLLRAAPFQNQCPDPETSEGGGGGGSSRQAKGLSGGRGPGTPPGHIPGRSKSLVFGAQVYQEAQGDPAFPEQASGSHLCRLCWVDQLQKSPRVAQR